MHGNPPVRSAAPLPPAAPRFTIVTPSFQQASFIAETIDSVLAQEGVTVDYSVRDGGSKDGTVEILARYGERLRWVSEPDGGQAAAINAGFRAGTGEIFGWLNSDDVLLPGALREVDRYFSDHPEVDLVYGGAVHIDEQGRELAAYRTQEFSFDRLLRTCFISQPAAFFRAEVFRRFGPLDETLHYSMDYEYWLRIAKSGGRLAHHPGTWAKTRLHSGAKTIAQRLPAHGEILRMLSRYTGRIPSGWARSYATYWAGAKTGLVVERDCLAPLGQQFHAALQARSREAFGLGALHAGVALAAVGAARIGVILRYHPWFLRFR